MGGRIAVACVVCTFALAGVARGAALVPLASSSAWGSAPIFVTAPPDDPRAFVVERGGGIRIVENGALLPAPFLTVPGVDTSGERGLLSMAFAPDYATSGKFYVFTVVSGGDLRVVEYRVSSDPDIADASSARILLSQAHPAGNHNGGQLNFGPDGLLYIDFGDGGSTPQTGQDLGSLLGKVLRIDPNGSPYDIPATNPFAGTPGARGEIYAYGFRNPFRASFDRQNGTLLVGDVGQSTWEEVDVGASGANYGWSTCEGDFLQGSSSTPCSIAQTNPFFAYPHSGAAGASGCAIIGGYVVRDPTLTGLTGRYLYGDLCRPDLRTLDLGIAGGDPQPAAGLTVGANTLLSFGEDARGCVYALADGTAYRVANASGDGAACPLALPGPGPVNTVRPQITGTPKPGATLTCSDGTWTNAPTSFTHQWKRDGVNIAGAGNATYAVDPADVGHQVTCVVTADNAAGTGHASSDAVVPANDVPVNVGPPALSRDGQALSCTNGTWSNAPTSFVLQWLRDGAEVAGANTATYVLSDADQGHAIRCRVTARNAVGSAVATSDAVDVPVPACTTCATSSAPTTTTPPSMSPSTIPVVPPPPADATAPSARVAARAEHLARSVAVRATCDEECDLTATGTLGFARAAASKRLRAATGHGAAGQRVTLRLRLSRAQLQRARRVLRRGGRVTATVTITATDAAGNRSGTRSRVMLR